MSDIDGEEDDCRDSIEEEMNGSDGRIQQKEVEELVVVEADAVICPYAKVVHLEDTSAQRSTVMSTWRFEMRAMRAESVFSTDVFSTDEMNSRCRWLE